MQVPAVEMGPVDTQELRDWVQREQRETLDSKVRVWILVEDFIAPKWK